MKNRLLFKLNILHDLVLDDRGDEVLESALNYFLSYEKAKLDNEVKLTREEISKYVNKFNMTDREFLRLYESGKLEDFPEYLEWFALLSLEANIKKKLELVEEVISQDEMEKV